MPAAKGSKRQEPRNRPSADRTEERWDALFRSLGRIDVVLLVGAFLLLLVLIYSIQSVLSPFVILGAILFLLYPLRTYDLAKKTMWLSVILFAIWFFSNIGSILAPFVVSLILAYILNPIVNKAEQWRIPRWLTSLFIILLLIALVSLVLFFVLPVALAQFEGILNSISVVFNDFNNWIVRSGILTTLEKYGITSDEVKKTLQTYFTPRIEDILKNLLRWMLALLSSLSSIVTQIFYIVLLPFLTFYLLTDFPRIVAAVLRLFPTSVRARVEEYGRLADQVIGLYLRGILTVAFLQGVMVFLLFSLVGIKYALVLGVIAAALDLVPYFGLIITMVLAGIVASFSDPPVLPKVLFALGSIEVLRIFETMYLAPRIVGNKVGLHPLLIIFSILVFFHFIGFIGLLVAVPVTALVVLFVREWEARRRGMTLEEYHSTPTE
jgi:predicted PurR-regulated permease PerM